MLAPLFVIQNARVWNSDVADERLYSLKIVNGMIESIDPQEFFKPGIVPSEFVLDALGHVLMPSGVDGQVHLRCPGQDQKEKPETGLRAALRGGIGAIVTMPNTEPVLDSIDRIHEAQKKVAAAENMTGVRVLWTASMTIGQKGEKPVDLINLAKSKSIVAFTDDGKGVQNNAVMEEIFSLAEKQNLPLLQHAEFLGHGGCVAPSPTQEKLNLTPIPDESEWKMVERDLALLRKYPRARYHLLHASLRKSVELIKKAKSEGLQASCEVCPHHLLFTSEDLKEGNTSFKMNPPLRSSPNKEALLSALSDGDIDFVATDHAPHEPEVKTADFAKSAFGTTGLEASLRVLLGLWTTGILPATRLVEVFSWRPAEFYGVSKEFGAVRVGRPLRAILVDPESSPRVLKETEIESLSKNSVFLGSKLQGRIVAHFNQAGLFRFEPFERAK